jgi:hypothetical protein
MNLWEKALCEAQQNLEYIHCASDLCPGMIVSGPDGQIVEVLYKVPIRPGLWKLVFAQGWEYWFTPRGEGDDPRWYIIETID